MNELQVKTINLTPAVVEFNYEEISMMLDDQLAKYEGLTFTEKDAAACKKTITELNKGKKALDTYRKKTKKELTEEVIAFENKCKVLGSKFDEVINPLKEQHDQFEEERKNIKRLEIEGLIDHLVHVENLNEKYAAKLTVEDSYLTKSKTIKSIKEELTTKAAHLGVQQDKEEANLEVIKSHVELINTKYGVNLLEESYTTLLEYQSVGEIKGIIENHAQLQVDKEEAEAKAVEYKEVPLSSAPKSVSNDDYEFIEVYTVTGTESQLDALEEFMDREKIKWTVNKK
ncbi:DUF1351 domain-containing protein [Ornithinibacillus salinisoli]|uniref:DUF1351 domain-containing protein n=1 Tax=Ornithinibacillus salinisoli TaxID=1848459 RepID=A0ABW4W2V7_9BACI